MSLRVWLPLNGNLNNQGLDQVTVTNNEAVVDDNGKIGKCYSFNGSNTKIINTFPIAVTSSIGSLSCWFKMNSLPGSSGFYNLLQLGNLGGYATCRLGFYMEYTNYINISIDGSSTATNRYTHSMVANQWYHVCVTYNGTIVKLYLNGNEVLSKTVNKGSYNTAASYLYIGGTSSYYLNGKINDARYYDHALSPLEVKQISQGLILHYPLNRNGWGNENLLRNTSVSVTNGSKTGFVLNQTIPSGTKVTFSLQVDAINLVLSGNKRIGLEGYQNNGTNNSYKGVWISGVNAQGTYSKRIFATVTLDRDFLINNNTFGIYIQTVSSGSVTISNPKIEISDKPTPWCPNSADELYNTLGLNDNVEYDTSGYRNNGTKVGTFSYASDTPKYNVSTKIAASASGIKLTNFSIGNIWSMSVWFKYPSQDNTGWKALVILNNNGSDSDLQFGNYINCNDGRIQYSANGKFDSTSVHAIFGEWNHLVSTYDGTTLRCYFNGEYKTSLTPGQTLSNRKNLGVGFKSNAVDFSTFGASMTNGLLSDVRIYATALSAQDVLSLYNNSAYIDNQGNIYGAIYEEV